MKKVFVSLLVLAAVSFGMAQSFTVGGIYQGDVAVTAEYGLPVESVGELLLGVSVVPFAWDTEVSVGARALVLEMDGADLTTSLRVHVPVYDGEFFVLGQMAGSLMLDLVVPQEQNDFSLVASAGVRAPLTTDGFTSFPDVVFGIGLRYQQAPLLPFGWW